MRRIKHGIRDQALSIDFAKLGIDSQRITMDEWATIKNEIRKNVFDDSSELDGKSRATGEKEND